MRITYLHQYFKTPSEPGGSRSYEFARRLVARGHDVDMVTSVRDSGNAFRGWQVTIVDGIRVHAVSVPYGNSMPYRDRIRAFLRFSYHAARRASSLSGDVVFATSTPLTIALPGAYAARRRRVPMVFEVRDLWPEVPIALGAVRGAAPIWAARRLEAFAYRNAAHVVALSPTMRDGVVRAGYPADRIHVVPNGCDLDRFSVGEEEGYRFRAQYSWLGDRPLVLYAGAFGLVNGVRYLVDVARAMKEVMPEARFLLLGEGREEQQLREYAGRVGILGSSLFILPRVPKRAMPAVFSAATVSTSTVMDVPALWANSANKVFDAFAASRPVVINHEGWQADLLRESGAGIVLPARDPQAGAEKLAAFLDDGHGLCLARRAARRLAETRFSRDQLFDELERVLLAAVTEGDR